MKSSDLAGLSDRSPGRTGPPPAAGPAGGQRLADLLAQLNPYPAYKDSGVPWLGKVPAHWEVMPVKRALRPQSCGNAAIKNTAAATPLDGYAPAFSASGQDVWLPRALHCGSALVLSAVGARCGKTFRADGEWGVVANTHILWPRAGQNRDYWWYVTNNEAWWDKAGAAQPFVRVSATLERSWVIPPLPEQTAIVRFLDYMDRRIRRYIRAKQKLIKLLEEYRQALIHQAVTGKIDVRTGKPYPAYKDSGVPWLGQVPEHWEMVPLRQLASGFNNGTSAEQISSGTTVFPVSRIETISTGAINYDKVGFIREENFDPRFWLQPGDILLSHINSFEMVGNCAQFLGERPLLHGMNLIRIRPKNRAVGAFIFRFMKSAAFRYEMRALCKPAINQVSVTTTAIKGIHMPLPPLPEQTAIVEYLDAQTAKLDAAMAAAGREIELLREYREQLIADVVTGKVDVREVAAQLPEETEEETEPLEEETTSIEETDGEDSEEETDGEE